MGRTQLQDAVPMTSAEFHAFNVLLNEETKSILRTAELLLEVNLGATAIGTRLNTRTAINSWRCRSWLKATYRSSRRKI